MKRTTVWFRDGHRWAGFSSFHEIEDGVLALRVDGQRIAVFASGQWTHVTFEDAAGVEVSS